jgi:hypothetical protein
MFIKFTDKEPFFISTHPKKLVKKLQSNTIKFLDKNLN